MSRKRKETVEDTLDKATKTPTYRARVRKLITVTPDTTNDVLVDHIDDLIAVTALIRDRLRSAREAKLSRAVGTYMALYNQLILLRLKLDQPDRMKALPIGYVPDQEALELYIQEQSRNVSDGLTQLQFVYEVARHDTGEADVRQYHVHRKGKPHPWVEDFRQLLIAITNAVEYLARARAMRSDGEQAYTLVDSYGAFHHDDT